MTEKRFQWVFIKDNELEFQDNGIVKRFENYRLEEFLNELNDEINVLDAKIERLIKMLDNVANFMQKQNKDVPLDDFVEWWNKIATEGLDD